MKIPSDTHFLFVCEQHNCQLSGTPKLAHPTLHATAVWAFDTSDMQCLVGDEDEQSDCQVTWGARSNGGV